MKVIDVNSLNLADMKMLDNGSSESSQYVKENNMYKLYFESFDSDAKIRKNKKLDILMSKNIPGVVFPKEKIMDIRRDVLKGCTMDYIKDTNDLADIFKSTTEINVYLELIRKVSKILKSLHNNKIICGDLSFENIIYDKSFNPYFIDCDSYQVNNIKNDMISVTLYQYMMVTGNSKIKVNENTDRLTILLNILIQLTNEDIYNMDEYRYDELAEQIRFLKEIKPIVQKVMRLETKLPEVPYLDEYITGKEIYRLKRH